MLFAAPPLLATADCVPFTVLLPGRIPVAIGCWLPDADTDADTDPEAAGGCVAEAAGDCTLVG